MAPTNKNQQSKETLSSDEERIKATVRYKEAEKKKWPRKTAVSIGGAIFGFVGWFLGTRTAAPTQFPLPSTALQTCLNNVCGGAESCVRYPGKGDNTVDFDEWAHVYNRALPIVPIAVARPRDKDDVPGFVRCAAQHGIKVQAKSGGHSFANFGLGGENGLLSIDLVNLGYVQIDKTDVGRVKIGSGSLLGSIDDELAVVNRVFPHGVCPGVGIGGHATIGGLGPLSRQMGATLDNILEVEVTIANGSLVRASEKQNLDLFFAIRGAGAGFGIVTEFVMKTHPKPPKTLSLINRIPYSNPYRNSKEIVDQLLAYQELVGSKDFDRRFACEFELNKDGLKITGTWFGDQKQFDETNIGKMIPGLKPVSASWGEVFKQKVYDAHLILSDTPTEFYSRSLGFTREDRLSRDAIENLLDVIDTNKKSTAWKWFVIFDATGGKVAEPSMDSTAYAHRDKVMFYQSYSLNRSYKLNAAQKGFLHKIHDVILSSIPDRPHTTYPGYVDLELGEDAQKIYWGSNLARLQKVKTEWDPKDVFHNPQSVRPL